MNTDRPGAAPAPTLAPARSEPGPCAQARGGWTDAAVETLKALWADGDLSAAVIARRLGVTRNAVLGKVHRLGLSNRRRGPKLRSSAPKRRQPRSPRPAPRRAIGKRPAAPEAPAVPEVGPGLVARLEDLARHGCHWPIGDPASVEFRFCGRPAPRAPYCEGHRLAAYKPGGPRPVAELVKRFARG